MGITRKKRFLSTNAAVAILMLTTLVHYAAVHMLGIGVMPHIIMDVLMIAVGAFIVWSVYGMIHELNYAIFGLLTLTAGYLIGDWPLILGYGTVLGDQFDHIFFIVGGSLTLYGLLKFRDTYKFS
jgi:hypothetical protein